MLAYIPYPSWIHPQIVSFLPVRWYGLMYLIAFAVAYLLFRYQLREQNIKPEKDVVLDMFFWGIVGLLVGARAFAVTIYDSTGYYLHHPLQIILPVAVVDGRLRLTGIAGMSYHGGLVGATIAIVVFLRVKKINVLQWGDMLVSGIPLGYTFGRLGNFINAELYGRVTRVPWGMVFPGAESFPSSQPWVQDYAKSVGMPLPVTGLVNLPRHPSQLYEAFFEGFVLWLIMWFIVRKRKPYDGFGIACYVIGYAVIRFFIEYVRQPDKGIDWPIRFAHVDNPIYQFTPFNFTTGQILNVLMIIGAIVFIYVLRWRARLAAATPASAPPSARKLRKKLK